MFVLFNVDRMPPSLPHCLHKLSLAPADALYYYRTHDNYTVLDDKVLTQLQYEKSKNTSAGANTRRPDRQYFILLGV